VRLAGGDIHVVQSGPPSAPAVVLLHGTAGSTAWWDPVMPALRDRHVVRVDLLGHGRSAKPAGGYRVAEQARRVGAVLDHLGVRRATVVGHSTGGMVATSLAEQRRDLVTAIALIDTGPRVDAYIGDSLISRLLPVPVVGQLIWRLRTDNTIRGALGTAFTRKVTIPDQIIADVRDMTYRSFTATYQASLAFLRERPVPDRLAELGLTRPGDLRLPGPAMAAILRRGLPPSPAGSDRDPRCWPHTHVRGSGHHRSTPTRLRRRHRITLIRHDHSLLPNMRARRALAE
jgi:pimeloyl-ACP methyl ester carboxylesterase